MKLLIVRHAIAQDSEELTRSGRSDDERPLTGRGISRMRRAARGLIEIVDPPSMIASSPLLRARQTAELLAEAFPGAKTAETETMHPGANPRDLLAWLERETYLDNVALVGHQPHLGQLISWLLCGECSIDVQPKKGSACLLQLDELGPGRARLLWYLAPSHLRKLGG